ncbi:exosortase A [Qipengyuania sp. S6317L1]|uniref:exosortase A n=1 Tax=Qipengyuania sp. S6317L1 TaxID=2926410 RepID=UPI001FF613A6|nr:exosortase A [Qipengyuania sp. S6317L1]MCK0099444.1 exosortase A [Qipengyuania sp. S6317L1]
MPPETTFSPASKQAVFSRISPKWREALVVLILGALASVVVTIREWAEMLHQWWNIDTYSHILLIPIIIGWLVALKASELAKLAPRPWLPGLGVVALGLSLWLIGRVTETNLIAHAGAVGTLQGIVIAVLGPRVCTVIALPLCFGVFLVPFGDEIIEPLQVVTAEIAIWLTHLSGIPAFSDGIYIDTPVGLFIVAEACSGVRFLIAMITLSVLVAYTRFTSWSRRAAFMVASIIVPVVANGVRAWGTIYIAQSQGVDFAAGFDHVFYGWFFFAFVVVLILGCAWRYFERDPEDYGWRAEEVLSFAILDRFAGPNTPSASILAGILAFCILAGGAAVIAGSAAIG